MKIFDDFIVSGVQGSGRSAVITLQKSMISVPLLLFSISQL